MTQNEVVELLHQAFDGRDPLAEAHMTMKQMGRDELTSLVLVAANRIGTIVKGDDYEDALDAAVHVCHGIETIFQAYYSAWINNQATVSKPGNA